GEGGDPLGGLGRAGAGGGRSRRSGSAAALINSGEELSAAESNTKVEGAGEVPYLKAGSGTPRWRQWRDGGPGDGGGPPRLHGGRRVSAGREIGRGRRELGRPGLRTSGEAHRGQRARRSSNGEGNGSGGDGYGGGALACAQRGGGERGVCAQMREGERASGVLGSSGRGGAVASSTRDVGAESGRAQLGRRLRGRRG
ncbi:hypothetical protein Zm00014a_020893, partial [Zea mays]